MNIRLRVAIGLLAACLAGSPAPAETSGQQSSECPKITAAERIDGTVTNIDQDRGTLTLLSSDGTIHKFQASRETLQELKVGEKIETKLRVTEKCRKG